MSHDSLTTNRTESPAADTSPAAAPPWIRTQLGNWLEQTGMLAVLAVLVIACSLTVDDFFTLRNLDSLLLAVSTVGIISCTMLFCLASGNFDLSVGTIVPCAGVVAAVMINKSDSILIGILAGLAFGALVGFVNGVVVAKCKINPLITTLATYQIVKGLAFIFSGGKSVGITHEAFFTLSNAAWPVVRDAHHRLIFQLTTPVWICIGCFLFFGFLLQRTTFGRNTLAIGGNEEAARLAGIPVARIKILIFVMQGTVAALAGIVLASRMTSGQPKSSDGLELQVISACVLGGVSLTGGVGRMSFVIAGVFIMGVVQNAMNLKNVDPFYQYVVSGTILLLAVLFDRVKQMRGGTAI
jgi:L-arabinose transport system permease protein